MREGITTGTCAAGAAKAAAIFLQSGKCPEYVNIFVPDGRELILKTFRTGNGCGVIKDAGCDSDITDGAVIVAEIELIGGNGPVVFEAGEGVGVVTLPGMKVPPGEPAINPVPRAMIKNAVRDIFHDEAMRIKISIPGGQELAKKTFNSRLGVVGGLSILGTTGIVRPDNEKAFLDSITLELNVILSSGFRDLFITFGNSGETALRKAFNVQDRRVIQAGNYPGYVIDEAVRLGFRGAMICGHPGKLLKVASGSFNTHNRIADGRIEALCTYLALSGVSCDFIRKVYESNTTESAIELMRAEGLNCIWNIIADAVSRRCTERSFRKLSVEAAFINHECEVLGQSSGTESFLLCLR